MKICLYAIAKNEIKEVDAWYESMKEADEIIAYDKEFNKIRIAFGDEKGNIFIKHFIVVLNN